jgi:hypothetical protein
VRVSVKNSKSSGPELRKNATTLILPPQRGQIIGQQEMQVRVEVDPVSEGLDGEMWTVRVLTADGRVPRGAFA